MGNIDHLISLQMQLGHGYVTLLKPFLEKSRRNEGSGRGNTSQSDAMTVTLTPISFRKDFQHLLLTLYDVLILFTVAVLSLIVGPPKF